MVIIFWNPKIQQELPSWSLRGLNGDTKLPVRVQLVQHVVQVPDTREKQKKTSPRSPETGSSLLCFFNFGRICWNMSLSHTYVSASKSDTPQKPGRSWAMKSAVHGFKRSPKATRPSRTMVEGTRGFDFQYRNATGLKV